DLLEHAFAKHRLAQHELDQLRAQDEAGEPPTATVCGRDARRVARQCVDHGAAGGRAAHLRSAAGGRATDLHDAVTPALAHPGGVVGEGGDTERVAEPGRAFARAAVGQVELEQTAAAAELHHVVLPALGRLRLRAVAGEQSATRSAGQCVHRVQAFAAGTV